MTRLIYLDACCLNRPFDDQAQSRVRLEAEAVLTIIEMAAAGKLLLADSDIIDDEIAQMPDLERLGKVKSLLAATNMFIEFTPDIEDRAREFETCNITSFDALHLAAAEAAGADFLLTTDDNLLRRAARHVGKLKVKVENPVKWIIQESMDEN